MPTLKNLVDEVVNIENEIIECRDTLKQILIDNKIQGLENENKLSVLINKVNNISISNDLCLYKNGFEHNITGGLIPHANNGNTTYLTVTKHSNYIQYVCTNSASSNYGVSTKNKVDLTNYSSIRVKMKRVKGSYNLIIYVLNASYMTGSTVVSAFYEESKVIGKEIVFSLDVSKLSGSYYLAFVHQNANDTTEAHLIDAWLLE